MTDPAATEYDAIVLDNDGILTEITDVDVFHGATRHAFEAAGVADPPTEHVETLHGVRETDIRRICEHHGIDPDPFWRRRDDEAARRQGVVIREGEKGLYPDVDAIFEVDAAFGIASNNQHETIRHIVEYFDLDRHVETYYGRDHSVEGVRKKKPDPHYIELALDDLGTENALYVGDSQTDVVAANRAGLDSAFVRRPHRADLDLDLDPTYEVMDLRALRDRLLESAD